MDATTTVDVYENLTFQAVVVPLVATDEDFNTSLVYSMVIAPEARRQRAAVCTRCCWW
jgi:hypothetical protein